MNQLPKPHYHRHEADPDWLAAAVQFHGHLGPWAAAGLRAGMAGCRATKAQGYFDVQVTVEGPFVKPPKSCFLDGLQVATGATWGKRNIKWVAAEEILVRVENTRSGQVAEVRPTPELTALLTTFKPRPADAEADQEADHDDDPQSLEAVARKIAALPESKVVTMSSQPK